MGNTGSNNKNPPKMKIVKGKKEYITVQKPPQYTELIDKKTVYDSTDVVASREIEESEEKAREEFKKRIEDSMPRDISYIDNLIKINNVANMISPYDPYIIRWMEKTCDKLYLESVVPIGNIIGVSNIKKYIKYNINNTNEIADKYYIYTPRENKFIKEAYACYYNILELWNSIFTIHTIYMNMWKPNGELRQIFGSECKPFLLRFILIETEILSAVDNIMINRLYSFLNEKYPWVSQCYTMEYKDIKKSDENIIHRREDGFPDFDSIKKILKNKYDKTNTGLLFYIGESDINKYVRNRIQHINSLLP